MTTENIQLSTGGRKPKANPAVFRYSISLNEREHNEFLSRFEKMELKVKAHLLLPASLTENFKVVKIYKVTMDYIT